MHSIYHNYAPKAFDNVWILNERRDLQYELRQTNDLIVPHPRIELFKKAPSYSLAVLWNNLDYNKYHSNRFTFKYALKNSLFGTESANQIDPP